MSLLILTVSLVVDLIYLTVDFIFFSPPYSNKSPIVKPFDNDTLPPPCNGASSQIYRNAEIAQTCHSV